MHRGRGRIDIAGLGACWHQASRIHALEFSAIEAAQLAVLVQPCEQPVAVWSGIVKQGPQVNVPGMAHFVKCWNIPSTSVARAIYFAPQCAVGGFWRPTVKRVGPCLHTVRHDKYKVKNILISLYKENTIIITIYIHEPKTNVSPRGSALLLCCICVHVYEEKREREGKETPKQQRKVHTQNEGREWGGATSKTRPTGIKAVS